MSFLDIRLGDRQKVRRICGGPSLFAKEQNNWGANLSTALLLECLTKGKFMDFAGLAALLAIPAGLIASSSGLWRERSLFQRWERMNNILDKKSLEGAPRKMVENARDHLAERMATNELTPRHTELLIAASLAFALGVGIILWITFDPSWKSHPELGWARIVGWISYGVGLVIFMLRAMLKTSWLSKHRGTNYLRTNVFL